MKLHQRSFGVAAGVFVLLAAWGSRRDVPGEAQSTRIGVSSPRQTSPNAVEGYDKLPLRFEANQGQTDGRVKFLARGQGYTLFLTSQEAVLSLRKSTANLFHKEGALANAGSKSVADRFKLFQDRSPRATELTEPQGGERATNTVLEMRLVGSNTTPRVKGVEELPGRSNYFIGNDQKKWRTNIPTYAKVRVEDIYPGVDLVYYGNQGQLEYDFVVRPGVDPTAIKLALTSPSLAKIDAEGDLVIQADGGEVRFHKPVIYQPAWTESERWTAEKRFIAGGYTINDEKEVAFVISDYDKTKPLVIDPVLSYSTYLGGGTPVGPYATTSANAIAVDGSGSAYVTGATATSDFPTTSGGFQGTNHSSSGSNAFVAKFSPDGSTLLYSTYLGGSAGETGMGIALDGSGNAYVTGMTYSADFPTVDPLQNTNLALGPFGGSRRFTGFVTKVNATGSALLYSTYLGGSGGDAPTGIAVDGSGNAYLVGTTYSADYPTANPIQPTNRARMDPATNGFVSEINATGSALVYSTYLGGSGNSLGGDESDAIAVDGSGNAYVTGYTRSADFPTTPNALQSTCTPGPAGCNEGFLTKINVGGTALAYSTYLAQAGVCEGIAVDGGGNAYVTGVSAIVAKLNPDGSTLIYFTNLNQGGNGFSEGKGITVDGSGNAYVIGYTEATNFPTANSMQGTNHGNGDAFVTELTPDGSGLVYSTYLGGSGKDQGNGIAVDGSGNVYVAGSSSSSDFPTANPFQATNNTFNGSFYSSSAFVAKIASATTQADTTPPTAPTNLAATAISSTQINLAWTASTDNVGVTNYLIQRCVSLSCSNFAQIGTTGGPGTTYNDTTASPSTSYNYRVIATDAALNQSLPSNMATAVTTGPPAAPSTLTATATSATQVNLSWTNNASNQTGFRVERSPDNITFTQIATTAATTTAYSDSPLSPSTLYYYRVRATNGSGDSPYSNLASATTLADTTPPTAPSNLAATAVSSTQINLAWTVSTDNVGVIQYQIQRCQGAGCAAFAQAGTSATPGFSDTGLLAGTSYSYQVRALDAAGNASAFSNVATAVTQAAAPPPPVTLVQHTETSVLSGTGTISQTFPAASVSGDLILVTVKWGNQALSVSSISDNKGNIYTSVLGPTNWTGTLKSAQTFYANSITGGGAPITIRVTLTGNSNSSFHLYQFEYTNIDPANPIDTACASAGVGTSVTCGPVTTNFANDLLYAVAFNDSAVTNAGAGFTTLSTYHSNVMESMQTTAAGSYRGTASNTSSTSWFMHLLAIKRHP